MKFAWIVEPPFNYRQGGALTGCDVELARHLFAALGVTFEAVEADFADLLDGLTNGRWDVATGMFVTPQRSLRAAFTKPIWALRDGLLIAQADTHVIKGYRDLARLGGKLAVLEGQVQHQTAIAVGIPEASIVTFRAYDEAAQAVENGRVRAYASVELAHRAHVANVRGLACAAVDISEKPSEPGAFACRNEALRDRLNLCLDGFLGSAGHRSMLLGLGLDPVSLGF